jgi:hypothetical protein
MSSPHIPETFLRQIWQQQRFTTSQLCTSNGKPVTILSPGSANSDGGPDFVGARIRIAGTMYHGDVELHQDPVEWHMHNHDADPHYNRVILHVVLTADPLSPPTQTASHRPVPVLALHPFLDPALHATLMNTILEERNERVQSIACSSLNDPVHPDIIIHWMEKLSHARMELKVRRFDERLKQLIDERRHIIREPYPRYFGKPEDIPLPGKEYTQKDFGAKQLWEQVLYEGIMEAMGFSKNREPFRLLAQSMRLDFLRAHSLSDAQTMMSLLFGAAGLLPSSRGLPEKENRDYVRSLRKRWKAFRPVFKGVLLNEGDWLFFRLRPVNFPTARMAAMCYLLPALFGDESFRRLITLFKKETLSTQDRMHSIHSLFGFAPDEFWQHHYHFHGRAGRSGIVLGSARINDIIMNAIIPIVLLYARVFKNQEVRAHAKQLFTSMPAAQENNITRTMQQQLLKEKGTLDSALLQQGAIQLYKFYCVPTRCSECDIGKRISRVFEQ